MAAVESQSAGQPARFTAITLTVEMLNVRQFEALSGRRVYGGMRVTAVAGSREIERFGGGRITIRVPVDLPAGADGREYAVFHLAEDGTVKSAIGIGALLLDGIGDTIRVSLSAEPEREVEAALSILRAVGLRKDYVEIIACPTCGRACIEVEEIARRVRRETQDIKKPIKVAVMGCVVNGPGEAREADYGIAGGKDRGLLFKKGQVVGTYDYDQLLDKLMELIRSED